MDRIVSLADYENFVRSFAGIGKVQATLLWTGQTHLVHLTVADQNGQAIESGSALLQSLEKAVDIRRSLRQTVQINSYVQVPFYVVATLVVDPRVRTEDVEQRVQSALAAAFSFQQRAFGQAVAASEVIATIQAVSGVVAVDLDHLSLTPLDDSAPESQGTVQSLRRLSRETYRNQRETERLQYQPLLPAGQATWNFTENQAQQAEPIDARC